MKSDFAPGGATRGVVPRATNPCDVGSVDRIRCWLRSGTWKTAHPRGTYSHLFSWVSLVLGEGGGGDSLVAVGHEEVGIQRPEVQLDMADPVGAVNER